MAQAPHGRSLRGSLRFVGAVTLAHVITYLLAGTLAYFLIYQDHAEAGGLDPFMRDPNDPEEWQHVEKWLIPAQVLRGVLFGVSLLPFVPTLTRWTLKARFLALLGLLLAFSVWSVTMPGPGSIEGWLYLKPGSATTLPNPLLGHIEVPAQLAVFSLLVSWRLGKRRDA